MLTLNTTRSDPTILRLRATCPARPPFEPDRGAAGMDGIVDKGQEAVNPLRPAPSLSWPEHCRYSSKDFSLTIAQRRQAQTSCWLCRHYKRPLRACAIKVRMLSLRIEDERLQPSRQFGP